MKKEAVSEMIDTASSTYGLKHFERLLISWHEQTQ